MNIKEDIRPISFVKSHAAEILNQVNETHRPIYVTQNGEARAVLLDTESFENMKNALGLLKLIAIGENDIANKRYKSQEEVFNNIEQKLLKKKKEKR
ncbi:MAG: type II toxin-antitoxin system Phd/YefM family antitoxin [bacterium]|nr:type II toxin-antitoxin system Phd/YefM family antitoxin [bacterium]